LGKFGRFLCSLCRLEDDEGIISPNGIAAKPIKNNL